MKAFTFKRAGVLWPAGMTLLHVYVVADLARNPELAGLVASSRAALDGMPLVHVGDDWLHVTLCQIRTPADQVDGAERTAIAREVGLRLAGLEPFRMSVGRPFGVATGVLFEIAEGAGALDDVRRNVAAGVAAACGLDTVDGHTSSLHMSESYARAEVDDEVIARRLAPLRDTYAPLRVDRVELVDVTIRQEDKVVSWTQVAAIGLGAG
jgi:hypothetical protein